MRTPNIPRSILRELANPAPPGQRHGQMVHVALPLRASGLSPTEVLTLLRPRYGPDVPDSEIQGVIDWAFRQQPHREGGKGGGWGCRVGRSNPKKPSEIGSKPRGLAPPEVRVQAFIEGEHCSEADLWEASPIRLGDDWRDDGILLLRHLYTPEDRVNIVTEFRVNAGKASPCGSGQTCTVADLLLAPQKVKAFTGNAGAWIRMNPVDGKGISDANVTAFRFALLEFDSISLDLQLSFMARVSLPIAAILTSGGRSVHAWVRVDAVDLLDYRAEVARLFNLLAEFGIDRANKNPSRLSRLPGVDRSLGGSGDARQRLLYLASRPGRGTSILQKSAPWN